jgi:hypothetical protein
MHINRGTIMGNESGLVFIRLVEKEKTEWKYVQRGRVPYPYFAYIPPDEKSILYMDWIFILHRPICGR